MLGSRLSILAAFLSISVTAPAKMKQEFAAVPLTPEQAALVRQSVAREKATIQEIQKHSPLVQTYIQNIRPDTDFPAPSTSDEYMLDRVDFRKGFTAQAYKSGDQAQGPFQGPANVFRALSAAFQIPDSPTGFMDMMFVDLDNYDREHYDFVFVRRQFLGQVRTQVFDVRPKPGTGSGRFLGRIWIEDQDGNIVRFNGTYTHGDSQQEARSWVHFDSWRDNMQPGVWLPIAIYAEEEQRPWVWKGGGFRAQTHFWGYSLKAPNHQTRSTSVVVDNVINDSQPAQDASPLEAQRDWYAHAERNVLDRLVEAGLVATPSSFDKILDQVTTNLILGSKLALAGEIHCRVLLTTPLESLAVGNTILVSKGLVDVLPNEEDLAAMLSFQLAQIALGHHIDTRYAFDDQLLFPDQAAFQRIRLSHSDRDDVAAAGMAIRILHSSIYQDKLGNVGLFLNQLQASAKDLPALMTPRVGDSLLKPDGTPWLSALCTSSVHLEPDNLNQIAAFPLGSHLRIDAWDDQVRFLSTKPEAILNASEKMPLKLTPIYFRLARYSSSGTSIAPTSGSSEPASGDSSSGASSSPPGRGPTE
jgi:hypothetical protein